MVKIYIDMDGVLADFSRHYKDLFGMNPKDLSHDKEKFWKNINSVPDFYLTIPPMPYAQQLVDACLEHTPHVSIMSAPSRDESRCIAQKKKWLSEHISAPEFGLNAVFERDKYKYACPKSILIDDQAKKVSPWKEAGGEGIIHIGIQGTLLLLEQTVQDIKGGAV